MASVKQRGEFYTPPAICEFMAQIVFDVDKIIEEGKPVTMSEPTCGSGGIILKAGKLLAPTPERKESYVDLLRVDAIDINPVATDMTYVNTTLWGIPTRVTHGNALAMENWSVWENLHWKRVGENERLAMKEMIRLLSEPIQKSELTAKSPPEKQPEVKGIFETDHDIVVPKKEGNSGQFEMDF